MIVTIYIVISFTIILALALLVFLFYVTYSKRRPKPSYRVRMQPLQTGDSRQDNVKITWIGHATLFIRIFDKYILTDPVFSPRIGVGIGRMRIGLKRYTEPALYPSELPKIDVVLLSHAHMDHLDFQSLRQVVSAQTQIITAKNTSKLLRRLHAYRTVELAESQTLQLEDGLEVSAVPVRHWGNRFPWNRNYGWTGYVIAYKGIRIFFAGDTAHIESFRGLSAKFGPIDVACIPIGAYRPDSYQNAHCTPEQAWQMFLDTGAKWLIPIHWNTFVLSEEPVAEPLERLIRSAGAEKQRIVIRDQGKSFTFS